MCHHFKVTDQIAPGFVDEFGFGAPVAETLAAAASTLKDRGAWPLKRVPALRIDDAGELAAFAPEWGLLPRWWKPSDKTPKRATFQRKTINARSETAAEKPSFRDAWRRRRCLLPLAEFFERDH